MYEIMLAVNLKKKKTKTWEKGLSVEELLFSGLPVWNFLDC